jgi:hypothetical protein
MREIGDGMLAVAEAIKASAVEKVIKDEVDSTVQGQAQLQVLEETCLTDEGHMVMVDLFTNATLARTYLAYRHRDGLRVKWLKNLLEKTCGIIDDFLNATRKKEALSHETIACMLIYGRRDASHLLNKGTLAASRDVAELTTLNRFVY